MRVDDIDLQSEVTTAFTIIEHEPGVDVAAIIGASQVEATTVVTIECGAKTAEALRGQAWGTLHQMTPPSRRTKNPARTAAAKKAAATKAAKAKAEGTTTATAPAPGPDGAPLPDGAKRGSEGDSGAQGGSPEAEVEV